MHNYDCQIFSFIVRVLQHEVPTPNIHGMTGTSANVNIYTECPSRNGQNFGRVFLMLKHTDITQNTYVQS